MKTPWMCISLVPFWIAKTVKNRTARDHVILPEGQDRNGILQVPLQLVYNYLCQDRTDKYLFELTRPASPTIPNIYKTCTTTSTTVAT